MAKRSFLKPLSAVFAALASATAWAHTKPVTEAAISPPVQDAALTVAPAVTTIPDQGNSRKEFAYRQDGDLFKFVLERGTNGDVFQHFSHSSHESHSSHSSHRSHYSSR